jgi:formylglycine-generating enzyme required for sulfatase activity
MIWPAADRWRAPVGDFPPRWASAWGDDQFGLWADLTIGESTQRMRWIEPTGPAGFWMGSPKAERAALAGNDLREHADRTEHEPQRVVVAEGFWLADTPCTQAFWAAVMAGDRPSLFKDQEDSLRRPVEQVSWDDVQGFLAELALKCPPLAGWPSLPTEVQWEYAARAGSCTAYPWGDDPDDGRANWNDQHGGTTPVGRFPANSFGLFDMHGNVWEWCEDPWRARLDEPDRRGPGSPSRRAVRGGAWIYLPGFARSAYRFDGPLDRRYQGQGFRLALRSSSPAQARQR